MEQALPEPAERPRRGLFITFEGADGTGKSRHARAAQKFLDGIGLPTLRAREPAGTEIGEQIRQHVLRSGGYIDPQAQALLFAADRAQNINTNVAPALARGVTVIQERYIDSSVAWTEAGAVLNPREILDLGLWAGAGLMPDLTVLLDVSAELAVERSLEISGDPGAEAEDMLEFHRRLRMSFLDIARREPRRVLVVDAGQAPAVVESVIVSELVRRFWS